MRRLWLRCSAADAGYATGSWIAPEPTLGTWGTPAPPVHAPALPNESVEDDVGGIVKGTSLKQQSKRGASRNVCFDLESITIHEVPSPNAADLSDAHTFNPDALPVALVEGDGERKGEGEGNRDTDSASSHLVHAYDDIIVKAVCDDCVFFMNGACAPRRRDRWQRATAWSLVPGTLRDQLVPGGIDREGLRRHHGRYFALAKVEMAGRDRPCNSADSMQLLATVVAGCLTKVDTDRDDEKKVVYKMCNVFEEYIQKTLGDLGTL